MFQGTLPHKAIKIIGNVVKEWDCNRIYVGCSGNFTIERSISGIVNCPITSNDVTIYSSNIGRYFSGLPLDELKIKDDYDGDCNFLRDYMKTDTEKVATMMLAADILPYDGVELAYCRRMLRGYKEQYKRLHEYTCKKLEECKTKIDTFYHGDVMKMLDEISTQSMAMGSLQYQVLNIAFLPSEIKEIKAILKDVVKEVGKNETLTLRFEEYDKYLDTLNEVGEGLRIRNTAVAFIGMLDIVKAHMDELKEEWIGTAKDKEYVPISTIVGRSDIRAAQGRELDRAIQLMLDRGVIKKQDKVQGLSELAKYYLEHEKTSKDKKQSKGGR